MEMEVVVDVGAGTKVELSGLATLPEDIMAENVACLLSPADICSLACCSHALHSLCSADRIWRTLYLTRWPPTPFSPRPLLTQGILRNNEALSSSTLEGNWPSGFLSEPLPRANTSVTARGYDNRAHQGDACKNMVGRTEDDVCTDAAVKDGEEGGNERAGMDNRSEDRGLHHGSVVTQYQRRCGQMLRNPDDERWQGRYMRRMAAAAEAAKGVVRHFAVAGAAARAESVEVGAFHRGLALLLASPLTFSDVCHLLLQPHVGVLPALAALHFSLFTLHIPRERVMDAVGAGGVGERHVCVRWWVLGALAHVGYRLRDQMHVAMASLGDLAGGAGPDGRPGGGRGGPGAAGAGGTVPAAELWQILSRGAMHEVMRVQISADFETSAWVSRDAHSV